MSELASKHELVCFQNIGIRRWWESKVLSVRQGISKGENGNIQGRGDNKSKGTEMWLFLHGLKLALGQGDLIRNCVDCKSRKWQWKGKGWIMKSLECFFVEFCRYWRVTKSSWEAVISSPLYSKERELKTIWRVDCIGKTLAAGRPVRERTL